MSDKSGRQTRQVQKTYSHSNMNTINHQNNQTYSKLILPKYFKLLSQIISNNFNV